MKKITMILCFVCIFSASFAQGQTSPIPTDVMRIMDTYCAGGFSDKLVLMYPYGDTTYILVHDGAGFQETILMAGDTLDEGCGCLCQPSRAVPEFFVGDDHLFAEQEDTIPCKRALPEGVDILHPRAIGWSITPLGGRNKARSIMYFYNRDIVLYNTTTVEGVSVMDYPGTRPVQFGDQVYRLVLDPTTTPSKKMEIKN